ncbi:hypothetical protein EJB05_40290 [Eragrostis curvula]|uniref:Peroxidase n=1 Tax=Eragrostis curvula TaxID=38414 RepID=A0A5J9TZP4_9POAL|nr:hypothetical protein EJB05_40290 [Eragrostis curvula]
MGVVLGGGRSALVVAMAVGVLAALAMAQQDQEEDVVLGGLYQPRDPCPQVESIVQKAVAEEFKKNKDITGGFLRVFFHDCFSGGCDASIFLQEEWRAFPVQERVRQFVNEIRGKVNKECGDQSVSCADILALATRDAVAEAKGPRVPIVRGRFDSKTIKDVSKIPLPGRGLPASFLIRLFAGFGLSDPADLVALSGAHTVGKTRNACGVANPDFRDNCMSRGSQDLDVITPVVFDNQYFVGLNRGLGMFDTDRELVSDENPTTKKLVLTYATDQNEFFRQWGVSFRKLSNVNWTSFPVGEIRRDCTRTNSGRLSSIIDGAADQ